MLWQDSAWFQTISEDFQNSGRETAIQSNSICSTD